LIETFRVSKRPFTVAARRFGMNPRKRAEVDGRYGSGSMSRSRVESFADSDERLSEDLIEGCQRLRRSRPHAGRDGVSVGRARCWLTKDHTDSDWPSLLAVERHTHALLEAVHELAKLLRRLQPSHRGLGNGRRRLS